MRSIWCLIFRRTGCRVFATVPRERRRPDPQPSRTPNDSLRRLPARSTHPSASLPRQRASAAGEVVCRPAISPSTRTGSSRTRSCSAPSGRETTVSPSVLRVSISEIRAALGDDADRFVTTVPPRLPVRDRDRRRGGAELRRTRRAEQASLHMRRWRARVQRRRQVVSSPAKPAPARQRFSIISSMASAPTASLLRAVKHSRCTARGEGCAAILDLLSRLCDEAGGDDVVAGPCRAARPAGCSSFREGGRRHRRAPARTGRRCRAGKAGCRARQNPWRRSARQPLVPSSRICSGATPRPSTRSFISPDARQVRSSSSSRRTGRRRSPTRISRRHPNAPARESERRTDPQLGPLAWRPSRPGSRAVSRRSRSVAASRVHDASGGHPLRLASVVDRLLDEHGLVVRDGAWQLDGRDAATDGDEHVDAGPSGDVADPPGHAAERRQLTVPSCDLVRCGRARAPARSGSAQRRARVQEAASAVLQRWRATSRSTWWTAAGHFCYPQAHEDDAERAVRAGLEVLDVLGRVSDSLQREHGIRPAVRIASTPARS